MPETSEIAVVPYSGERIDLSKPSEASRALSESSQFYYEFRSFQNACRDVLRAESDRLGQRSFETGGYRVEVESQETSQEVVYDVDLLWHRLEEAGLPLERLGELVTYEPKVDGRIIRQLKRNRTYLAIIEEAVLSTSPKTRTVRVKDA